MSEQRCNVPTCATYDQYVESQLMKEFITNNLPYSEQQPYVPVHSTIPRRELTTRSCSSNRSSRSGSIIVIPATATHSNVTKRYFSNKKLRTVKYVKRITSIAVLSQKIKKLKYEILLLEDMEMIIHEQMQDLQEKASRELYEDEVCG